MGKVYLVGAGPGAPDLLTLRAAKLLAEADVVFYDALVHPDTIALAVNAKKIAVGKRAGQLSTDQRFINRILVEAGLRHACVVRLKGGDPMLFGRAQEEIDALNAAGVPLEVVPGITSALAAAASLKTSLTKRGISRSVTFATPRVGHGETPGEWADAAASGDTAILYMAISEAEAVRAALMSRGVAPDTPVVIVENASLPNERQIRGILETLPEIVTNRMSGPAILCIGQVFEATETWSNTATEAVLGTLNN
ncbi:MAG: uroporphyrinogen-III C-methyltransferase [Pseudomonadota bacterium]